MGFGVACNLGVPTCLLLSSQTGENPPLLECAPACIVATILVHGPEPVEFAERAASHVCTSVPRIGEFALCAVLRPGLGRVGRRAAITEELLFKHVWL